MDGAFMDGAIFLNAINYSIHYLLHISLSFTLRTKKLIGSDFKYIND